MEQFSFFPVVGSSININPAPNLFGYSLVFLTSIAFFLVMLVNYPKIKWTLKAVLTAWLAFCLLNALRYLDLVFRVICQK